MHDGIILAAAQAIGGADRALEITVQYAKEREQFDKPMFFSVNLASGIGESFLFGGLMGRSYIAEFRKIGNAVQLIARNERFFAQPSTPEAVAVAEAFSDSLIASGPPDEILNNQHVREVYLGQEFKL
mgnify:CR=1 FL=1